MNQTGAFHIKAAILGDLDQPAFAPPANRIEAVRSFSDSEGGMGDRVETEAMAELLFEVNHDVESTAAIRQVEQGIPHQYFVIEVQHVIPNHQIRADKLGHELVNRSLVIDAILPRPRAVSYPDGHTHIAFSIPAPRIVRCALRFEIEINDVFHAWR